MSKIDQELLDEYVFAWVEVHKKSALTFLVLRALQDGAVWSQDIGVMIQKQTGWIVTERGLYRLLRRLHKQGLIDFFSESAPRTGAERKIYQLTQEGGVFLDAIRHQTSYLSACR